VMNTLGDEKRREKRRGKEEKRREEKEEKRREGKRGEKRGGRGKSVCEYESRNRMRNNNKQIFKISNIRMFCETLINLSAPRKTTPKTHKSSEWPRNTMTDCSKSTRSRT